MALVTQDTMDGIIYTGATNSTIKFRLLGGKYFVHATAADTTNVLSILCPDGSTYNAVDSETTSAFAKALDLPPGSYEIVTTSSTAVQGACVKIPYNPAY